MKKYGSMWLALFGAAGLALAACAVEDDTDEAFRLAAAQAGDACEEVYPYVVEAKTEAAAETACAEVCAGVVCDPPEVPAESSVPGNAGDRDSWLCDCTCPCADEDADPEPIDGSPRD